MNDVKVKICGVTTEADARACLDAGADYIGLIFAESERRVTRARAEAIRQALPKAKLVGVFAGHDGVQIAEIARLAKLDLVQMHGGEPLPLRIAVKERTGLPVARVLHAETIIDPASPFADDTLLYDLPKGRAHSEAELALLWEAARRGSDSHHRVFLAGGLSPDNVAEAVRAVRPYAVDVSRGVESAPGVKDLDLVRRFIEEVRGA